MLVKKFEAKTMKEALELVKVNLGPEAIILSAKDNSKSFGLLGQKSVEVTAAITEAQLKSKLEAEAKLKVSHKGHYQKWPARAQRRFIEKSARHKVSTVAKMPESPMPPKRPEVPPEPLRYIEIGDEEPIVMRTSRAGTRSTRVRRAVEMASQASQLFRGDPVHVSPTVPSGKSQNDLIIKNLESQVFELKGLVEHFQKQSGYVLPTEFSASFARLTKVGVHPLLANQMLHKAEKELSVEALKKPALIDAWLVKHLLEQVRIADHSRPCRYHVLAGSFGQGKTTTLVKWAGQLVLKERAKIGFVSLDAFKLGASEQLKVYAQILNVPFALIRRPEEWSWIEQKWEGLSHIFVDMPGLTLEAEEERQWFQDMISPLKNRQVHLVQSLLTREDEASELARRYKGAGCEDMILTRIDETIKYGSMINLQGEVGLPIHSFAMGRSIPEDFAMATREQVVDWIFQISNHHGKGASDETKKHADNEHHIGERGGRKDLTSI